jgi:hypothetical protein
MSKHYKLNDWLFILLSSLLFSVVLIWITVYTQGIDLNWVDWMGLPFVVIWVISLLGSILLYDYLME